MKEPEIEVLGKYKLGLQKYKDIWIEHCTVAYIANQIHHTQILSHGQELVVLKLLRTGYNN